MPKREYKFWVYMMANRSRLLYTSITNNLRERVYQHKKGEVEGFTKKYNCHSLVWFEEHEYVNNAIAREKQIKKWRREKKIRLVEEMNPEWKDLSEGWYDGDKEYPL